MHSVGKRRQLKLENRTGRARQIFNVKISLQEAVSLHRNGQYQQAEQLYRKILEISPENADALNLLGLIAYQSGRHETAVDLIAQAIKINPSPSSYHLNLGNALKAQGKLNEAVNCYNRALEIKTDYTEAYLNLGNILQEQGRLNEAIDNFNNALKINPNYAEAHNNLGNVLKEQGRLKEASEKYIQAIKINPDYARAHYNLGLAFKEQGKLNEATASYRRALKINPNYAEAYNNLGNIMEELGNIIEAVACYREAIRLDPNKKEFWINFSEALHDIQFSTASENIKRDLIKCLSRDDINQRNITNVAINQLRITPSFQKLISDIENNDIEAIQIQLDNDDMEKTLSDPLLLTLLNKARITDPLIERLLTEVRRSLLNRAVESVATQQNEIWNADFIYALSNQCFYNEYVYYVTEQEISKIELLKEYIQSKLKSIDVNCKILIAILSCYIPIYKLENAEEITYFAENCQDQAFQYLHIRQIKEPLMERGIRKDIIPIGNISDDISLKVRSQYEENPYPRWTKTVICDPKPVASVLKELFPHIDTESVSFPDAPEILIAGCGTGKHAIIVANRFKNSRVLAVDLSLTSLAYAMRKMQEMRITNIEFRQVDILNLPQLCKMFDIIECAGVLHHMHDPYQGWSVLIDLLRPGGFMKIGLYSEIARQLIVEARVYISEQGYAPTPDGIRSCRRDIMMHENTRLLRLLESPDFYSLSTCRDLIFHVQEHRFTIPQIAEILNKLNLEFIGFELPDNRIKKSYCERFPDDPKAVSLPNWHQYEQENPLTFTGIYQLWLRKPA